jgi:phospholipid transport system substrate-binding protein
MTIALPARIGLAVTAVVLAAFVLPAAANTTTTAHSVVSSTTERVMAVVQSAPDYIDDDPERYYRSIQSILDPVVDFRGFARNVMGAYATSERYRSLDAAGRERLVAQLDRFTEVMRTGLVRTYGKGLIAFGGSRIEISKPSDEEPDQRRVAVRQLIFSEQTEPYEVIYQMGLSQDGAWQLRNMIIENVNLGEIYRSQFEAAARKQNGDIDAVIERWSAETPETDLGG